MIILNHGISACTKQNLLTTVLLTVALDSVPYGYNPCTSLDLAPILDLKHVNVKAEDLITQIQEIHTATAKHLQDTSAKYKQVTNKKRLVVEFDPLEILEKINPNAYRLKLPSHMCTFDIFIVKHLVPYQGENSNLDSKLEGEFLPTQGG